MDLTSPLQRCSHCETLCPLDHILSRPGPAGFDQCQLHVGFVSDVVIPLRMSSKPKLPESKNTLPVLLESFWYREWSGSDHQILK